MSRRFPFHAVSTRDLSTVSGAGFVEGTVMFITKMDSNETRRRGMFRVQVVVNGINHVIPFPYDPFEEEVPAFKSDPLELLAEICID